MCKFASSFFACCRSHYTSLLIAAREILLKRRSGILTAADTRLNIPKGISAAGSPLRYGKSGGTLQFSVDADMAASTIVWEVPSELILESHGHCVAIYGRDLVKIGEAVVDGAGPVIITQTENFNDQDNVSASKRLRITAKGPHRGMTLNIRKQNFQLQDRGLADPTNLWRRWDRGERSLSYLLEVPRTTVGRSRLVVVFSAIGNPYDFTFNYRSALSDVDSYRLFLLDDFGKRGAYYLSDHRDFGIYHSVQNFLRDIFSELRINVKDVTFAGSSKGGTAALIHGLPLEVGQIVVGAPQAKPGTYLASNAPDMLKFIAGVNGTGGQNWLDAAAEEILSRRSPDTQVRVLVGDADHHLMAHVRPLEAVLAHSETPVKTLVVQGVSHREIGWPFSVYLNQLVSTKNKVADALIPYELSWQSDEKNTAQLKVWVPQGEAISVRAFAGEKLLGAHGYSNNDTYSFTVPKEESVRIRIYRRHVASHVRQGAFTTPWLRPAADD